MPDTEQCPINRDAPLSIIVVGASGDLAQKKVFPALFALYSQDLLPKDVQFFGFARTAMSSEQFREETTRFLTCRYVPGESCADKMDSFLKRCQYVSGQYHSRDSFLSLYDALRDSEKNSPWNRLFYMAIPPFLFLDTARSIGDAGLVHCDGGPVWARAVIEKPFGRDRSSSDELTRSLSRVFSEEQTYRIDHYLGKEVIQNLMVLRFANLIFDLIWNREHVHSIKITWTENIGVEGRGGYFDEYGIIRDVMQNHLVQILALLCMEQPVSLSAQYVRDEKVKSLRSIPPLRRDDLVIGQYRKGLIEGVEHSAYREEEHVKPDSRTPTYAAAVLHVKNRRWDGVPFFIEAGKGLDSRKTEIHIQFRHVPGNIFAGVVDPLPPNKLIIRIQPDGIISFRIMSKVPGLQLQVEERDLDLHYKSAFSSHVPEAYETLLLDVIRGDKSLFLRADELESAWDIFTPVLNEIDSRAIEPEPYDFGSCGPSGTARLISRYGIGE